MSADEERIALFLDYENLAIGARENLGGMAFDLKPVADALAERGRVVVRRAYADWLKFAEDGRMLTRHHVELIEIPQRMGSVRKNAADIKMAVDALEMCFERDYITTFVLGTGDSDFTPLVHKLREHNKQVIGLGVQMSTSALLPPACDEFLFYERLEGVEVPAKGRRTIVARGRGRGRRPQVGDVGEVEVEAETETEVENEAGETAEPTAPATLEGVERLISQTLSGLERSSGTVRASSLKRAVLRKESTFSEADYGFRGFTELLRSLSERGVIELVDSSSPGDPDVQFPIGGNLGEVGVAFELLASTVESLVKDGVGTPLSGLKTQLRRRQPDFSEKRFGFGGFLQFAKAAVARGVVAMAWNDDADDYLLTAVTGRPTFELPPADAAPASAAGEAGSAPADREVPRGTADDEDAEADTRRRNRSGRGGRGRNRNGAADAPTPAPAAEAVERTEPAEADHSADSAAAGDSAAPDDRAGTLAATVDQPAEPAEPAEVAAGTDAADTGDSATGDTATADSTTELAPSDAGVPDTGPAPADTEPVAEAATVAEPASEEPAPKRRRRTTKAKTEAEPTPEPAAEAKAEAAPARAPRTRRTGTATSAAADAPTATGTGTTTRRRRTTKAAEAAEGGAGAPDSD